MGALIVNSKQCLIKQPPMMTTVYVSLYVTMVRGWMPLQYLSTIHPSAAFDLSIHPRVYGCRTCRATNVSVDKTIRQASCYSHSVN